MSSEQESGEVPQCEHCYTDLEVLEVQEGTKKYACGNEDCMYAHPELVERDYGYVINPDDDTE